MYVYLLCGCESTIVCISVSILCVCTYCVQECTFLLEIFVWFGCVYKHLLDPLKVEIFYYSLFYEPPQTLWIPPFPLKVIEVQRYTILH